MSLIHFSVFARWTSVTVSLEDPKGWTLLLAGANHASGIQPFNLVHILAGEMFFIKEKEMNINFEYSLNFYKF